MMKKVAFSRSVHACENNFTKLLVIGACLVTCFGTIWDQLMVFGICIGSVFWLQISSRRKQVVSSSKQCDNGSVSKEVPRVMHTRRFVDCRWSTPDSVDGSSQISDHVNSLISHQATPTGILDVAATYLPNFDLLNIVTVVYRLAKKVPGRPVQDPRFKDVLAMIPTALENHSHRLQGVLSNLFWAMAKLKLRPTESDQWDLLRVMCKAAIEDAEKFDPQETSSIIWALSVLVHSDRRASRDDFLFAGAPVKARDWLTETYLSLADASKLVNYRPQELSNTAVAFCRACSGVTFAIHSTSSSIGRVAAYLEKLSLKSLDCMHKLEPQHIANTIWAFVKLGVLSRERLVDLLTAGVQEAVSGRILKRLKPQETANIVWSLARANVHVDGAVEIMARHVATTFHQFNAQDFCNWAWAMTTLNVVDANIFDLMIDASIHILSSFTSQELSNYLAAITKSGCGQNNIRLFKEASQVIAHSQIRRFSSQALINVTHSYAVVNVYEAAMCQTLVGEFGRRLDRERFKLEELSNLMWALGRFQWKMFRSDEEHRRFQEQIVTACLAFPETPRQSEVCTLLWALSRSKIPSPQVFRQLLPAIRMRDINPAAIEKVSQAFAKMDSPQEICK